MGSRFFRSSLACSVAAHGLVALLLIEWPRSAVGRPAPQSVLRIELAPKEGAASAPSAARPLAATEQPAEKRPSKGESPRTASASRGNPDDYFLEVRERIAAHLEYPLALRRRRVSGRVQLKLTLNTAGQLISTELAQSSGHAALDLLALDAVKKAAPFPAPFPMTGSKTRDRVEISRNLPIDFQLDPPARPERQ